MILRTLFVLPAAAILLVTVTLAGTILGQGLWGHMRGEVAIGATERMRLLVLLAADLTAERMATNGALSQPEPHAPRVAWRLAAARTKTDARLMDLIALSQRLDRSSIPDHVPPYLVEMTAKLGAGRAAVDLLLARNRGERTVSSLDAAMIQMASSGRTVEKSLLQASMDVVAADPAMSGMLIVARLADTLKDGLTQLARVLTPRFLKMEKLTEEDIRAADEHVARMAQIARDIEKVIEIAGPTDDIRRALAELRRFQDDVFGPALRDVILADTTEGPDETGWLPPQRAMIPFFQRAETLRIAIVDAAMDHVTRGQRARRWRLTIAAAALAVVTAAIVAALMLLHRRVVRPLVHLAGTTCRIAAGEHDLILPVRSNIREVENMAAAVETLRRAALIADAAASRQREAARQRMAMLREALDTIDSMREPSRAMVAGVTRLAEGFDAVRASSEATPPSLERAAEAVRAGLAALRAAVDEGCGVRAAPGDGHETEAAAVTRIMGVLDEVNRRDAAVRGFVQPGLAALRDASAAPGVPRELVARQFECIEETVAAMSAMRASAERAVSIVRTLTLDGTRLAAPPLAAPPLAA